MGGGTLRVGDGGVRTNRAQHPPPFPNSSLPPSRGEVRWGVERCEPAPTALLHPDRSPATPQPSFLHPSSVIPAQAGNQAISSACARHEAATAQQSRFCAAGQLRW